MTAKPRLATIWLDGCSGCHMSLLDMDERLLEITERADIVFGALVDVKEFPENVDVTLVEGAPALGGKFVMGGIREDRSGPADAAAQARIDALVRELGTRFVVAPGCSLPDDTGDLALASLRALAGP